MTKPEILITGGNGQLGQSLRALSANSAGTFVFADRTALDVTNQDKVMSFFQKSTFDFCINTAAYTKVDLAETEPDLAFAGNVLAPRYLASACKEQGCTLVHFSSDYVYHNDLRRPLKEDDPLRPQSVYARTKLQGEEAALAANEKTIVIRSSWVFSEYGHNFVRTMLRLMRDGKPLRIVNDQQGSPTYAVDLGRAVLQIIDFLHTQHAAHLYGIYNYCNSGETTWAAFAQEIAKQANLEANITQVSTAEYGAAAKRPEYSTLDCQKIRDTFHVETPDWKDALDIVIRNLS